MTFVGRIFVIVIMAFALLFLGISTVVFTTTKNWKTATEDQKKEVAKLQTSLKTAQGNADAAKKELEGAKGAYDTQTKQLNDQIKSLNDQIATDREQIEAARSKIADAQANAKTALVEAEHRRTETYDLREKKAAVEKQANDFKLQQTELNDRIRELERMLDTTQRNRDDLRDTVARFSAALRAAGLPDDPSKMRAQASPPRNVAGQILRIDASGKQIEFTNGTDEGLVVGHEMYVFRKDKPEYVGKIVIVRAEPDQSVGRLLGQTYHGRKFMEGDIVSSTLNP